MNEDSLIARLDEAAAWLEVHPPVHPVTRTVAALLRDLRAVLDAGRAPGGEIISAEVLADGMPGEDEELADLLREISRLWQVVTVGRRRRRGPSPAPVFVIAGARPVRSAPTIDGGLDVLAFDWETGRLLRDMTQLDAVVGVGDRDVEVLDVAGFYDAVADLRRRRGLPSPAGPTPESARGTAVDWLSTGDAPEPYRAEVDGDEWLVRVRDWPEDPTVYTLIVNGRETFGFDGWPDGWSRP